MSASADHTTTQAADTPQAMRSTIDVLRSTLARTQDLLCETESSADRESFEAQMRIEKLEFELSELKRDLRALAESDETDGSEIGRHIAHYARTLVIGHSTRFGLPGFEHYDKIRKRYAELTEALKGASAEIEILREQVFDAAGRVATPKGRTSAQQKIDAVLSRVRPQKEETS